MLILVYTEALTANIYTAHAKKCGGTESHLREIKRFEISYMFFDIDAYWRAIAKRRADRLGEPPAALPPAPGTN